jgi:PBSX family phage terminase large subunit
MTMEMQINLFEAQGRFVGTSAHYAAFVGGIGSGKSHSGAIRALMASQGYIGSKQRIPTPNLGIVTAPTYPMLRDSTLRTFLDVAGDAVSSFNKSDMLIKLANGSEIIFRSTEDSERLRGSNVAWWFGDEAALYTPGTWRIMIGRLRQFGQQGYAWIATTPRGRNWLYQVFIRDNADNPDYKIFKASSSDNIYLDRAVIDAWRQSYVGDFARQELEGEFVAFEGLVYPEFDRGLHVTSKRPDDFHTVIAGVDWGFANAGVIQVIGLDYDNRAYLVHEEYARQRRIEEWVTRAVQLRDTWKISAFYCDPSEPDYIKAFTGGGLKATQANNTVTTGIQAVKARLVRQSDGLPRLLVSPSCVNTIAEFESYQWSENRYGMKDAPVKSNDHCQDSLRYGVMGIDYAGIKKLTATTQSYIG